MKIMGDASMGKHSMLDVAARAGVSKTTVSYVLNGKTGVSEETKSRVLLACQEMGYRINPNIQDFIRENLSGSTRNIALVFVATEFADPAYARIIDGVAKGTEENKYHLLFAKLTGAEETVYDLPPILRDGRVDGVLISGDIVPRVLSLLREIDIPCVILGDYNENITREYSNVSANTRAGIKLAIEALGKAGKTRIAFFNETLTHHSDKMVLNAYREGLADNNLPVDEEIIYVGKGSFSGAMGVLEPIFHKDTLPFDSIVCIDYRVAMEISHLIMARAWRIGKYDVVIAAGRPYSYYKLPIPSMYMDLLLEEVAYAALEELLTCLSQGESYRKKTTSLSPTLVSTIEGSVPGEDRP